MAQAEQEETMSLEELLSDIWGKAHRTEALLTVILRNQAEIISKTHGITMDEALSRINQDIAEVMGTDEEAAES